MKTIDQQIKVRIDQEKAREIKLIEFPMDSNNFYIHWIDGTISHYNYSLSGTIKNVAKQGGN